MILVLRMVKKFYNLFLEYADKGSLVDHLQQNGGKLMESNVKRFARSMLKGINFFHSQGFVHCDIKLQNVLLFGNGDVKIADFGLAKRKGANMVDLLIKIGANNELPRIPRELSGEGKDFMEKCFSRDPNKRWTAEMLLQHPFMASDDEIVPSTSSR
ncbi:hypothetical protein Gotur_028463, partial [Gossypium turneri]